LFQDETEPLEFSSALWKKQNLQNPNSYKKGRGRWAPTEKVLTEMWFLQNHLGL
jgi:hypothetical protein